MEQSRARTVVCLESWTEGDGERDKVKHPWEAGCRVCAASVVCVWRVGGKKCAGSTGKG